MANEYKAKRYHALTTTYKGLMREIRSPVKICSGEAIKTGERIFQTTISVWDTGATNCVISPGLVKKMQLTPISKTKVIGVTGESESFIYLVDIVIGDNVLFQNVSVTEGIVGIAPEVEFLIGMDVIAAGDFSLTAEENNSVFSFRIPHFPHAIDYVKEINRANEDLKRKALNKESRKNYNESIRGKKKKKKR